MALSTPHNDSFALAERRKERLCTCIQVAACLVNHRSVAPIDQSVHEKHSHLAKHVIGDVAWSLRGQHTSQTVLAAFLGNKAEGIQVSTQKFISKALVEELVRLVEHHY